MKDLLPYVTDSVKTSKFKYEVHSFDSGAVMVDIWIASRFYVIQIDDDMIGLSMITEEVNPFTTVPDRSFKDASKFKTEFERILR